MKNLLQKSRANIAAIGTAAVVALAPAAAFAGELASAVEAGVDKAEIMAIGVVLLSISGLILLIRSGRKASGG